MDSDMQMEQQFMKEFLGSAAANMVFVIAFVVYTGIKKLCARNSKCHSKIHTCCLDIDIQDKQTIREQPLTPTEV